MCFIAVKPHFLTLEDALVLSITQPQLIYLDLMYSTVFVDVGRICSTVNFANRIFYI